MVFGTKRKGSPVATAESTVPVYAGAVKSAINSKQDVSVASAASVEESVFKGYLQRAVRDWVLAGKPYKR